MDDFHVLDTYRFILSSLRALLFVVDCCRLVCVCVDDEGGEVKHVHLMFVSLATSQVKTETGDNEKRFVHSISTNYLLYYLPSELGIN